MSVAEYYTPPNVGRHLSQPVQWIHCSKGNYPHYAVEGGYDSGDRLLVARANFNGALVPGKIHVGHSNCYLGWKGQSRAVEIYEVLVAPPGALRWVPSYEGCLLSDAVVGGHTETGEQLLVGRAHYAGMTVPGKVKPSQNVCCIAYGDKEYTLGHYDILMR